MERKVIDIVPDVADRENSPRGTSRFIFWVMWDSVHKTADMPIKMNFISVPEPFTDP
jgi:hypothetical protein